MKKAMLLMFSVTIFLTFANSCGQQSSNPSSQSTEPFPIIDMHMHTFQWNKYGEPPPPNLITGNSPAARSNSEAIDAYIAEMDRYNVVLAVGSGEMEMVEAMNSRAQDRFLGGTEFPRYTTPVNNRIEDWPDIDELRKLYVSDQLQILGEITRTVHKL